MFKTVGALALVAALGSAPSCMLFDRRGDAERLDHQVRAMPGVSDTDVSYQSDFTNGERFDLTVTLRSDITDQQVSDIGRAFVVTTAKTGLEERSADLSLHYPVDPPPPKNNYTRDYSDAQISVGRTA